MKRLMVLFAFLFALSTSFTSCRDTAREADDVEMEVSDDLEETGEEIEDEFDDM